MEYEFTLTFKLPSDEFDEGLLMSRLAEAGCTDVLVGLGVAGRVGLEFVREAETAEDAILSALSDVQKTLPGIERIVASDVELERVRKRAMF